MDECIRISPGDPVLTWEGALSIERNDAWLQPWRLPLDLLPLAADGLRERAGHSAGVRISFVSDACAISGEIDSIGVDPSPYGTRPIDIVCDGELIASVAVDADNRFRTDRLPDGTKHIELWLPHVWRFRLRSLELASATHVTSTPEKSRKKWLVYGSSIEQCVEAETPTQTWPAIVAHERDMDLVCLGFGAQCHLDTVAARAIRDTDADIITLCLGINVQIASTLNIRTFRSAVTGFVLIIREKHPHTPIALVSPIVSPPREAVPNVVGMTMADYRDEVRNAHRDLVAGGDERIVYIDGRDLMGYNDTRFMPDGLHPNAEGYRLLAKRYLNHAYPLIEEMFAS